MPGVDVPDREIVQAQDLRPQVGVTEMLGGQIAQALPFFQANGHDFAFGRNQPGTPEASGAPPGPVR